MLIIGDHTLRATEPEFRNISEDSQRRSGPRFETGQAKDNGELVVHNAHIADPNKDTQRVHEKAGQGNRLQVRHSE